MIVVDLYVNNIWKPFHTVSLPEFAQIFTSEFIGVPITFCRLMCKGCSDEYIYVFHWRRKKEYSVPGNIPVYLYDCGINALNLLNSYWICWIHAFVECELRSLWYKAHTLPIQCHTLPQCLYISCKVMVGGSFLLQLYPWLLHTYGMLLNIDHSLTSVFTGVEEVIYVGMPLI